MADKFDQTRQKSPVAGWLDGMRSFNEFIRNRRRDLTFPVFRFRGRELAFLIVSVLSVWLCANTLDYWYLDWLRLGSFGKDGFFSWISPVGNSVWIFILTGVIVIFMWFWNASKYAMRGRFYWQRLYHKITFILLSSIASGLLVLFLKNAIGRIRPKLAEDNIFLLKPFSGLYDHASFPSGHSATTGTLICCIILLFPRYRVLALCLGTLIPVSRLMVEAHFPSDVLAGYLIGIAVTWYMALYYARLRLVFQFDAKGRPILREYWQGNWKKMVSTLARPKY